MSTGMAVRTAAGWEIVLGASRSASPTPTNPEVTAREALVWGNTNKLPSPLNTGALQSRPRTNVYWPNDGVGRYYNMAPGERIVDAIINAGLRPNHGCSVWNAEVRGWTVATVNVNTHYGLVDLSSASVPVTDFLAEHITLIPAVPSPAFYGVRGAGGLFRFAHVARVQDGSMSYRVGRTLEFHFSLFERPLITNPDPTRNDGDQTHADVGGQPEGASYILRGCYVIAWDEAVDGPYATSEVNGGGVAALQVTGNQTSAGDRPVDVIIDRCFLRGGNIPVYITPNYSRLPTNGVRIIDTKIGFGMHNYGGAQPYKHIVRPPQMGSGGNPPLITAGSVGWNFETMTSTGGLVIANAS